MGILIAIKLTFIATIFLPIVLCLTSCTNKESSLTSRATYHDISKVEIENPYSNPILLSYDAKHQPEKMQAIVDEINSQSHGFWRKGLGGKEGANVISIHIYSHTETPVASFSLFSNQLMERGPNYRQLNVDGFFRQIDIQALPALKEVWCGHRDIDAYNSLQLSKSC